jgi:hypothetical protein
VASGVREQEHRHRRGHTPLPRGRAPLGAHGGEPDEVDVREQAAEHQAGELHRDVGPRRRRPVGRRLLHLHGAANLAIQ